MVQSPSTRRSAASPGQGNGVTDQPFADPKVDSHHLTEQWLDVIDGDEPAPAGRHDDTDTPGESDAALAGDETPVILVQQEVGTELSSESDRLGFSRVEADDLLKLCHKVTVAWGSDVEPRSLSQINSARTSGGYLGVDNRRDDDARVERRQEPESPNTGEYDQRAGIRDDQLVDRAFLNDIATSTC